MPLDLAQTLVELQRRLLLVNEAIRAMEQFRSVTPSRGRRFMSREERARVSQRMRAYWDAKRDGGNHVA